MSFDKIGAAPWTMNWNYDGSLLACTNKNKQLHVFDPRTPQEAMVGTSHGGSKPTRFHWMGDSNKIISVGTSEFGEREWAVFDPRADISKPLKRQQLDVGTAPMQMHYDHANEIMFVVNKGSAITQFFYIQDSVTDPKLVKLDQHKSSGSNSYMYFMPKRFVDF